MAQFGRIRHSSPWLHALSLDLPSPLLVSLENSHACVKNVVSMSSVARESAPGPQDRRRLAVPPPRDPVFGAFVAQNTYCGAKALQEQGFTGKGVKIAILDSGFHYTHDVFANTQFVGQFDFVDQDNETMDGVGSKSNYHGTAALSILAANAPGMAVGAAPGASILLARTENIFVEVQMEEDFFVAGAEWAVEQGARILSASLGYKQWYAFKDFDGVTPAVTRACQKAAELGLLVVVANGNEGEGGIGAPADARLALSVGAVTSRGHRASYSSIGPTADGRLKPDVVTQGSDVWVANDEGGVRSGSGTSYAVPLVSGVAALIMEAHPTWTAQMVKEAIERTASQYAQPDVHLGRGVMNGSLAVTFKPRRSCAEHTMREDDDDDDGAPFLCFNKGTCDSATDGSFCRCPDNYYTRDCGVKRSGPADDVDDWEYLPKMSLGVEGVDSDLVSESDSDEDMSSAGNGSSTSYTSERDYGIESSDDFTEVVDVPVAGKVPGRYASNTSMGLLGSIAIVLIVVRLFGWCTAVRKDGFDPRAVPPSAVDAIVKMA